MERCSAEATDRRSEISLAWTSHRLVRAAARRSRLMRPRIDLTQSSSNTGANARNVESARRVATRSRCAPVRSSSRSVLSKASATSRNRAPRIAHAASLAGASPRMPFTHRPVIFMLGPRERCSVSRLLRRVTAHCATKCLGGDPAPRHPVRAPPVGPATGALRLCIHSGAFAEQPQSHAVENAELSTRSKRRLERHHRQEQRRSHQAHHDGDHQDHQRSDQVHRSPEKSADPRLQRVGDGDEHLVEVVGRLGD